MLNLNHHGWGKQLLRNQRVIFAVVCVIVMAMFGTLAASAAREIVVYYDGQSQTVTSFHDDPQTILKFAGIPDTDQYTLEETQDGLVLRVSPEYDVTVLADGAAYHVASRTNRVRAVLADLGITWNGDDIVTPSPDTIFDADCTIQVQRVTYQTVTRKEPVEPSVVYEDSDALALGVTAVQFEGVPGEADVTYYEKLVDGQVVEGTRKSTVVTTQPEDKVVAVGTAPTQPVGAVVTNSAAINEKLASPLTPEQLIAVDETGAPLHYSRCITGLATAYYAAEGAHTSTGEIAQLGYVAVDPKEIPYGTKMFIKTSDGSFFYGYAKAADTGGFITGPVEVDLYFPTLYECTQFGLRTVDIYVLD